MNSKAKFLIAKTTHPVVRSIHPVLNVHVTECNNVSASNTINLFVTGSGKTGLLENLKVSRNNGYKYLKCCSLPMVLAICVRNFHTL